MATAVNTAVARESEAVLRTSEVPSSLDDASASPSLKAGEAQVDLADVDAIVERIGVEAEHVVPILQALQARFGYLPQEALNRVCERSRISPARISGVASFYNQFRTRPSGRHTVRVCIGTACHVAGAETVWSALRERLGLQGEADTDAERLFTVQKVACLGCCMLAPAVQIDDVTYGPVRPEKVPEMLGDFLASRAGAGDEPASTVASCELQGELRLCLCSSCTASGARHVARELRCEIEARRLRVALREVGCTGMAYQAPVVEVVAGERSYRYGRVRPEQARALLAQHFAPAWGLARARGAARTFLERLLDAEGAEPVTRYLLDGAAASDVAFLAPQRHIATALSGQLDPLDLDAYVRAGGFGAARRCLRALEPEAIIARVRASRLRGRGGAGFPTAEKWARVRETPAGEKYVVANGDEGDPGAFMDRMLLESFPFRVLEGLLIASRAVGASRAVVYVREEYPLALARVRRAVTLCEQRGWLGEDVQGSGHSLKVTVVAGAGAFVCGEETALLAALEGRRGTPRPRPPYPAEAGLWGRPTLVNNVETLALLPALLGDGAEADDFATLGTRASAGSKCFSLAGKVVRSGLVEVPMGITLRRIVEGLGGGVRGGRRLKAVQIGGPSGGCVPERLCDTPVDFDALASVGAMMGSGGLVVLDEDDCMVEIARYFMAFTAAESCGRCTFCRVGTRRLLEILERLCHGQGHAGDLERLEQLAAWTQRGSLCGLGKTAPNPVLSTLAHFRDEYIAHLAGRCPAGRCRELVTYAIGTACIGCTKCAQACASGAIEARPYERHVIDANVCRRCGVCRSVCPARAVEVR